MKVVGLTGGIGSGKTTVAGMFADLGIPVYIADEEAKILTDTSPEIRAELTALLGAQAYTQQGMDRKYVASKVFNDKDLLAAVNAIIHPRVAVHFQEWFEKQQAPYVIKEAAILFESGSYKSCDLIILVTAPKGVRIERVKARDRISEAEITSRMENQWSDEEKRKLADMTIENIDLSNTQRQVHRIHSILSGA